MPDRAAFDTLLSAVRPSLLSRAQRELGPTRLDDAADVVQQTSVDAWAASARPRIMAQSVTEPSRFSRWLSAIESSVIADYWRAQGRQARRDARLTTEPELLWAVVDAREVEDQESRAVMLAECALRWRVAQRMREYSPTPMERHALELWLRGVTYEQVCSVLGLASVAAARKAKSRAANKLASIPQHEIERERQRNCEEYRGDRSLPPGLRVSEARFRFVISKVTVYHAPPKLGAALAREQLQRTR